VYADEPETAYGSAQRVAHPLRACTPVHELLLMTSNEVDLLLQMG
jgi:hypothetical protein